MSCPSTSSGLKTADAAILAMPGKLHGLTLLSDGTNSATLTIYDNASAASGTVLAKIIVNGTDRTKELIFEDGVIVNNGIYADLSVAAGTAEYIVQYSAG